jgi:hypothetical protein
MFENVKRRRPRRPKLSMVQIAGKAKTKLTSPNPKDARSEVIKSAPDSEKIVDE